MAKKEDKTLIQTEMPDAVVNELDAWAKADARFEGKRSRVVRFLIQEGLRRRRHAVTSARSRSRRAIAT